MISVTQQAAEQIQSTLARQGLADFGVRVQVVGGGCEGFLYDLSYVDLPEPEDHVFESQGVKLFVDPRSLAAVDGLTIDHGRTERGAGLVFRNPLARASCSCGASFRR